MSSNIDKIFYINLDRRTDRRTEIENELTTFELPFERFPAIERNPGIVGCGLSHLAVYKIAKERGYKNILIFEDDFYFLMDKQAFEQELTQFFDSKIEYNVCMLAYNVTEDAEVPGHPFLRRILTGQSAAAYIVNENYYDTLIALYEWALPLLEQTGQHWIYSNDQCWKSLQPRDNWYYFVNRIGRQRNGFSDNANQYMEYNC
jgi:glycosyl transferase family 25